MVGNVKDKYTQMVEKKKFPHMKKVGIKDIGVSLVSLGLGLGSGEFILWPLLMVTYGYGILWGALLGISIQLLLILEVQRYTSVSGEDFVSGVYRLHRFLPFIVLLSSVLGFGWPGFAASGSELLVDVFPSISSLGDLLPPLLLVGCAMVLLVGRNVYSKLEPLQSAIVIFSFVLLTYFAVQMVQFSDVKEIAVGLIGRGNGFRFFPEGLDMSTFLGAIAYAGTGGILILSQSFYTIEERHGMTRYFPVLSLWSKKIENIPNVVASEDSDSIKNFRGLRRFQVFENTVFFWLLGLLTIIALGFLAHTLLKGMDFVPHSLDFLRVEAEVIGLRWGNLFGKVFLMVGFFALISVQIGIYDITGRITVNILKKYKRFEMVTRSSIYVYSILVQLAIGVVLLSLGFSEPVWLLVTGAVINAVSMAIVAVITVILNSRDIPVSYRPGWWISVLLILSALFYISLFIVNIVS